MSGGFEDDDEIRQAEAGLRRCADFDDLNNELAERDTGRRKRFHVAGDDVGGVGGGKRDKHRRAADLTFYLDLIATGGFAGYVAGEIFDTKTDSEISGIVGRVEAKTGKSFKEYAAGILGPDAAKRLPGESEADYRRRVLKALTEEIIDPGTGRIKPEYADDPLAAIIINDAAYQRIMGDTVQIDLAGSGPGAEALVEGLKSAGYETAELSGHHVDADPNKGDLRDGQDGHSDTDLNAESAVTRNDSFFGAPSGIRQVSEAARSEFNTKSPPADAAERALLDTPKPGSSSGGNT